MKSDFFIFQNLFSTAKLGVYKIKYLILDLETVSDIIE